MRYGRALPTALSKGGNGGSRGTFFHNSVMGNFIFFKDRIETILLQLFEHPEDSQWFSICFYFLLLFLRSTFFPNRNKHISNDVFVFYIFSDALNFFLRARTLFWRPWRKIRLWVDKMLCRHRETAHCLNISRSLLMVESSCSKSEVWP